ncbi:hypothetical protein ABXN37_18665 [Piscinibacter sakaiensis]|uniref:hypothetical protein n=1 Tax=Piscinibacter sakaiensis TaxID=1547922 RepID=UPI0037263C99
MSAPTCTGASRPGCWPARSARRLYRSALEAIDRRPGRTAADDARWVGLAAKLAYTCVFDPLSLPDGLAVFERARLLAERSGERARYWLGYLKYAVGRFRGGGAEPGPRRR